MTGLDPTKYESDFSELYESDFSESSACPFVKLLNIAKTERDDFDRMTLLEIEDVSNLLKALFKVNLHIARREYFLKKDLPGVSDWWYGYKDGDEWISFEPTVEFKFSNFHAANQPSESGELMCCAKWANDYKPSITPVNRDLLDDAAAIHYSDDKYCYDYRKMLMGLDDMCEDDDSEDPSKDVANSQKYYRIEPLHLYENSQLQSPTDVNDFVRQRLDVIERTTSQVSTFTSIVKKYRPIVMPNVRDIFNKGINDYPTKYKADMDNSYGVFGWCSIPSKTMVNMEYNEQALVVPSSYDHHNRIGGSNFLQMDKDLYGLYKSWAIDGTSIADETWYYLYNNRDWTYFMKPVFNVGRNNDVFSYIQTIGNPDSQLPTTSDHLNGVVFEKGINQRLDDSTFGDVVEVCEFLARRHHGDNNLKMLAESKSSIIDITRLRELTMKDGRFNAVYGSEYANLPDSFRYPEQDWVDDFDKTGSYIGKDNDGFKYPFNLGQTHAIDDFDEDSVWFYITMVEPTPEEDRVLDIHDIMPFVFWWENRGRENNGPTVDCYGLQSSAKLNYEDGGYCYSSGVPHGEDDEQRWHAVQHTLGVDFSSQDVGGAVVNMDNSGNVYKGAFDPNCAGTDEKWKIHHESNAFGAPQHEDPIEDKYYLGEQCHGDGVFPNKVVPDGLNDKVLESIHGRPMAWNLWNIVRHYVYIKYFKEVNRDLKTDPVAWDELESRTRKLVRGIYRTFKEHQNSKFFEIDNAKTPTGEPCVVKWTNSFVEISSILERNDRKHDASLVMFTGNCEVSEEEPLYEQVQKSEFNFRLTTLDGVDSDADGMRPQPSEQSGVRTYNGCKYGDLPTSYIVGDAATYQQLLPDVYVTFDNAVDLDLEYPEAERQSKNATSTKWNRFLGEVVMNR